MGPLPNRELPKVSHWFKMHVGPERTKPIHRSLQRNDTEPDS